MYEIRREIQLAWPWTFLNSFSAGRPSEQCCTERAVAKGQRPRAGTMHEYKHCNAPAKSLWSCLILCERKDCSPTGSSVHGFPRQEYWSGLPCPPPFPIQGLNLHLLHLLHWQVGSLPPVSPRKPWQCTYPSVWKDVILLWKTDVQALPSSAHLFYYLSPSVVSRLSISLEATLLSVHCVPLTRNSSLLSSWFTPTHPWRQSPFFCYAFLPRTVHFFPRGLSWIPLQLSIAQSSFCSMNLFTFWNHQLPSLFSTWLWTLWMLKWDYAFYLCVPRLGSNEWMHWKSVSQKDGRAFLCQCS